MKTIMNLWRDTDSFTKAYIECALWSSSNEDNTPIDSTHSWIDLAEDTLGIIISECKQFQAENDLTGYSNERAGHDFWLTRNHHGAGFWENDFGTEEQNETLTKAAHAFGECDLYVGDDGKIYL